MITSRLLDVRNTLGNYVTIGNRKVLKVLTNFEEEYACLREGAMLYDCSTYGLLEVSGDSATDLLDRLSTKDIKYLNVGNVCECYFLNEEAQVVGSVFVLRQESAYLIITPWEQADAVKEWVNMNATDDICVHDYLDEKAIVQLEGPYAWKMVKEIFDVEIEAIALRSFANFEWNDEKVTLVRIGRSSEYGYMMITAVKNAEEICNQCLNREWDFKVCEGGFEALETAMLEVHQPNFYRETLEYGNIFELAQQWYIQADKDDYIGYDALMDLFNSGITKSSCGFVAEIVAEIEDGTNVYIEDECIGRVVYCKNSVLLNKKIGIICVNRPYAVSNITLEVDGKAGRVAINTISGPFIRPLSWDMKME